ncbi:MAG TPA: hypothetical protein VFN57_14050 [Thermomicrobiaceae bacterium]|nr:hypothetical protein [Thermomicrobiaceae bacterium]
MTRRDEDRSADVTRLRLHLLNQTTLHMWVLLGATVSLLGFTLSRLEPTLAIALTLEGRPLPRSLWWPVVLGVLVVLGGAVMILVAGARYVRREQEIDQGRFDRNHVLVVGTVAGTVLLGLLLAAYLIFAHY